MPFQSSESPDMSAVSICPGARPAEMADRVRASQPQSRANLPVWPAPHEENVDIAGHVTGPAAMADPSNTTGIIPADSVQSSDTEAPSRATARRHNDE